MMQIISVATHVPVIIFSMFTSIHREEERRKFLRPYLIEAAFYRDMWNLMIR